MSRKRSRLPEGYLSNGLWLFCHITLSVFHVASIGRSAALGKLLPVALSAGALAWSAIAVWYYAYCLVCCTQEHNRLCQQQKLRDLIDAGDEMTGRWTL